MKKLMNGMLALGMVFSAACATSNDTPATQATTEQELVAAVSGELHLDGSWTDTKDEALTMVFTESDENEYDITVFWGQSSSSARHWTMHGTYDPASGMLTYENGAYELLAVTPEGTQKASENAVTAGAILKEGDDAIRWTDSSLEEDRLFNRPNGAANFAVKFAPGPFAVNDQFTAVLTDEDRARFETGVEGQIGIGFEPVQLLATQTVSGTNYAYLAYATFVLGTPEQYSYVIVHLYEDLEGNLELMRDDVLDVNDIKTVEELDSKLIGSWKTADNDAAGVTTEEADDAFMEAFNNPESEIEIGNAVTIALLGTAEEAGSVTYRYLVRATTEQLNPEKAYFVVDVKKEGDSTPVVTDIAMLDLAAYVG